MKTRSKIYKMQEIAAHISAREGAFARIQERFARSEGMLYIDTDDPDGAALGIIGKVTYVDEGSIVVEGLRGCAPE